jgi:hypothetical protein
MAIVVLAFGFCLFTPGFLGSCLAWYGLFYALVIDKTLFGFIEVVLAVLSTGWMIAGLLIIGMAGRWLGWK